MMQAIDHRSAHDFGCYVPLRVGLAGPLKPFSCSGPAIVCSVQGNAKLTIALFDVDTLVQW
jgi:hypothetical protein